MNGRITVFNSLLAVSLIALMAAVAPALYAQSTDDPAGDTTPGAPPWTDILRLYGLQEGKTLKFVLETADSIPRAMLDSCTFGILLRTSPQAQSAGPTVAIEFKLSGWDGSPWFATHVYSLAAGSGLPADTVRLFDWRLERNSLMIRFSLEGLCWEAVEASGRIFYKDTFVDKTPDDGWLSIRLDTSELQAIKTRSSVRAVFSTPEGYDSVLARYEVLKVVDTAFDHELDLTGITPIGGDSVRFVFSPFYGGAAIEDDPIYLGPGMCGKTPLWFVYFHEMGHNFINASARFRQLYPLEMKLKPGPMPTHILFYEAWATLPAMYVFDMFERQGKLPGVADSSLRHVLNDWNSARSRFTKAWRAYKEVPVYTALNPDVVDGMLLELQGRFGWAMFQNFFALLRPAGEPLPLFEERLEGDTPDLRATRSTLTAAALSAAAGTRLDKMFKQWAFPVDDGLFTRAYETLRQTRK